MNLEPKNQTKLFGLENYINELIKLYKKINYQIKYY